MRTYITAFVLAALVAWFVTPRVRALADRVGWLDRVGDPRKIHAVAVPRVGGIAIAIAFLLPLALLGFIDNAVSRTFFERPQTVVGLFLGGLLAAAIGLVDDIRDLAPRWKLLGEVGIATIAFLLDIRIDHLDVPLLDPIRLGWMAYPLTVAWIVLVMNAINLIDGLDGLASGIGLLTSLTLFAVGLTRTSPIVALCAASMAGALAGFLRYNFNPASIFMGDSGSLFLGFVLGAISITGLHKEAVAVSIFVPLVAMGLPLIDTSITVVRRFIGGRPIFSGDRDHIHHRMLALGLTHRQVVLVLYGSTIVLGLAALAMVYTRGRESAMILAAYAAGTIAAARALGYLRFDRLGRSLRYGLARQQRLRANLASVDEFARKCGETRSEDELFERLKGLAASLGVDEVEVRARVSGKGPERSWEHVWARDLEPDAQAFSSCRSETHALGWSLGGTTLNGTLAFRWRCDEGDLQLPEAPCYRLLATVVRDRLLELAEAEGASDSARPVRSAET